MILKPLRLIGIIAVLIFTLCIFSACKQEQSQDPSKEEPILSTTESPSTEVPTQKAEETEEDLQIDTYIILDNEKTTINGKNATFENNTVTITDGGVYHLSGTMTDGKIYINSTNETKKVKLILSGVSMSCSTDAPVFVENSPDETVLILESGTQNVFSDTAREIPEGVTDYATAVIYSKDDLQIEGDGALTVTGNFNKGIFSKNDIDIRGGNIKITATDDGIRGKDSVEIEKGVIEITCGGDGIRTSEETEESKGNIDINGGTVKITSDLDAVQATGILTVTDGEITAKSGGGSTQDYSYISEGMDSPYPKGGFSFGDRRPPDSSMYETQEAETPSTKGIKADKSIEISGGTLTLDCLDDSIHSPEITVSGGKITASSDDDGMHGDNSISIKDGEINIATSYEGVEGTVINIEGGKLIINSSDDGFNASSGSTATTEEGGMNTFGGFGGKGGMGGMGEYDSTCQINMKDGFVLINAEGDGVDSNGNVDMTGGKVIVYGPTMGGNGALDYGGSFNISGGTLMASGSMGMAQSVTGNGVEVLTFNCNGSQDTLYTIADSEMNCMLAFNSPKSFQNVVFASDKLTADGSYSLYQDGTISQNGDAIEGICFSGIYSPGSLIGSLG